MLDDIKHRFEYHPPQDDEAVVLHKMVRRECGDLAVYFDDHLPDGREKSLAITKLEEAMFFANAAIARHSDGTCSCH